MTKASLDLLFFFFSPSLIYVKHIWMIKLEISAETFLQNLIVNQNWENWSVKFQR